MASQDVVSVAAKLLPAFSMLSITDMLAPPVFGRHMPMKYFVCVYSVGHSVMTELGLHSMCSAVAYSPVLHSVTHTPF